MKLIRDGGDFIEQCRQHDISRWRLRGLKHSQHASPTLRRNRLYGRDEVQPESERDRYRLRPATTTRPSPLIRVRAAIHSLTSVVLPKPAGAEMSVTLWRATPDPRSADRSGGSGWTTLGRGGGTYSFVAKMGADIEPL